MTSNVLVHRQDEEAAFLVCHVELGAEHLLDEIGIRHAAVGGAAEIGEVVENPFDRQLDDAAGLLVQQDLVGIVARHQAAVVEKARGLYLTDSPGTELPRRRPVADRLLADCFGECVDGARQHLLLGLFVVHRRQVLVNPAVHADLVPSALHDQRNHVGVEEVADSWNKEGRGQLMLVEQAQDARHAVDRAVLAARNRFGDEVAGGEIRSRVVDVEAEADGDARAVGRGSWFQPLAGADMKHLRADLIQRQLGARLWSRLCAERRGRQSDGNANPQSDIRNPKSLCHASSTPWLRVRKYIATATSSTPLMPMTRGAPRKVASQPLTRLPSGIPPRNASM